ncbi:hypothetical protein Tco_0032449 [Tanacetum coccineum]
MKWVSEGPLYITGGELEYPRELFLVPGQMTYLVTSLTLDSASSEGFLSFILLLVVIIVTVVIVVVILVVVVVVIVGVVIVVVIIRIVVVVMIIRVVVVVMIIGVVVVVGGNPPMKASRSFSVFGTMLGHMTASSWNLLTLGICIPPGQGIVSQGVPVGPVFLLGLLVFAIVAAYASRAAVTLSPTSFLMAA